jgi:sulfonate transport system substrate-binding protein
MNLRLAPVVRFLAISIALFSATAQAANPTVIRIGSPQLGSGQNNFSGANTLAVVKAKGWLEEEFKKDGIEIQWNFFRGAGPAVNEALANKQLDFVSLGDLAAIIGKSRGVATRLILPNSRGSHSYLATSSGSDIQSFKDLKGRKVAVLLGTAYQRPFDQLLADAGLTPRDVKLVNFDWPTSKAAVVSKDIDATFGGSDLLLLKDKGVGFPVSTKGRGPRYTIESAVLATDDFVKEYPQIVARVVKQLVRAAAWQSDEANRDKLLALWAEQSGNPLDIFKGDFEGDSAALRASPLLDEGYVQGIKGVVSDALEQKLIKQDVDVDAWVEPRFVTAALKELKLEKNWAAQDRDGKLKALAQESPSKSAKKPANAAAKDAKK